MQRLAGLAALAYLPNLICLRGTIIFSGKNYNPSNNPRVKEIIELKLWLKFTLPFFPLFFYSVIYQVAKKNLTANCCLFVENHFAEVEIKTRSFSKCLKLCAFQSLSKRHHILFKRFISITQLIDSWLLTIVLKIFYSLFILKITIKGNQKQVQGTFSWILQSTLSFVV